MQIDAPNLVRAACLPLVLSLLLIPLGCQKGQQGETPDNGQAATSDLPSDDQLKAMLDEALDYTLEHRTLSLQRNAAWQIMHGVLAYGRSFPVQYRDESVSAVDWVLDGGSMNGWTVRHGEKGVKAVLAPGSKSGQGHEDQWLAVLSQCHLPSSQKLVVDDVDYTVGDLVKQAMHDVYQGKECSWTLIGLTQYLPVDQQWKASDDSVWSIERIMAMEAAQEINASACGGSHRLIGMTMALERYRAKEGDIQLQGGWAAAQAKIDTAIETTRKFQQPSGAFSVNYFRRPGDSPDLATHLGTTGHTLEFLTLALDDEELAEPWVTRSVVFLCDLFKRTRPIDLECGALYHAAHGLQLYRARRFGPRPEMMPPEEEESIFSKREAKTPDSQDEPEKK